MVVFICCGTGWGWICLHLPKITIYPLIPDGSVGWEWVSKGGFVLGGIYECGHQAQHLIMLINVLCDSVGPRQELLGLESGSAQP